MPRKLSVVKMSVWDSNRLNVPMTWGRELAKREAEGGAKLHQRHQHFRLSRDSAGCTTHRYSTEYSRYRLWMILIVVSVSSAYDSHVLGQLSAAQEIKSAYQHFLARCSAFLRTSQHFESTKHNRQSNSIQSAESSECILNQAADYLNRSPLYQFCTDS